MNAVSILRTYGWSWSDGTISVFWDSMMEGICLGDSKHFEIIEILLFSSILLIISEIRAQLD